VVKVHADSRQNNKKATVSQFKMGILLNFVKTQYFSHIASVFHQKRNPLKPADIKNQLV